MSERPIIFSAPMVRALLDGRKTQTRRILKPQPAKWEARVIDITPPFFNEEEGGWGQVETIWSGPLVPGMCEPEREVWRLLKLPYAVGDRLWVREAYFPEVDGDHRFPVWYRATEAIPYDGVKWKPSIHMPRWASRITLEVTEVRVQRLQEISEEDAKAEGLTRVSKDGKIYKWGIPDRDGLPGNDDLGWHWQDWERDPRAAYTRLWNSLHGPGAWEANPWVAAISFKRVT